MLNVLELAKLPSAEAHRLVANSVGERGHKSFFEFKGRQACIKKAMAKPLPGASADAFIKGATKIDGESVREVLPVHIAALQAVESPLLEMVQKATESEDKKSKSDFDEQNQWDVAFIFTSEPKQLRKLLKDGGKELIQSSSENYCSEWTAAKLNTIILAVIEQFNRHVQTTVKFAAEMEGQVDKSFFQALNPKSSTPAALDG